MNSGNVKLIVKGEEIVCVFVLAKRGNILVQLTREIIESRIEENIVEILVEELKKDAQQNSIEIKGKNKKKKK
jgi:hypothetical protein